MKLTELGMFLLALTVSLTTLGTEIKAPLPKVFIIGDSISLGYTELVRKELQGVAEVSRPNENRMYSENGLKN